MIFVFLSLILILEILSIPRNIHVNCESITIATVSCRQQVDNALRRLVFSYSQISKPTTRTVWYILYHDSFFENAGSDPRLLFCKNLGPGCKELLYSLKEYHHVDMRFQPIRHNLSLHLFKPCATSRLWLDDLLPQEKAVLYLDTDTMVVEDLSLLWHKLHDFSKSVFMGMVAENFRGRIFSQVENFSNGEPFMASPYGINTGVMLIDLEKLRNSHFTKAIKSILSSNSDLPMGDQCAINIYVMQNPMHYVLLPCKWNTRGHPHRTDDHCFDQDLTNLCGILHGNRGHFTSPRTWLDSHVPNETLRRYLEPINKRYIQNAKDMQANEIWSDA